MLLFALFLAMALPAAAEEHKLQGGFGPDGTAATNFARAGAVAVDQISGAVYVIDQEAGALYRFGPEGEALPFSYSAPNIFGNEITGLDFHREFGTVQVAVNSVTHVFYVTSGDAIVAFEASGEPAKFTAGPGAGTNEIGGFAHEALGLAVDANGDIYTSDYDHADLQTSGNGVVHIYAPSGASVTQFETPAPANLAVAPDGSLYVTHYAGKVSRLTPNTFPVEATTAYTPQYVIDQPAVARSLAVDPSNEDLYLVGGSAGASSPQVWQYDSSGNLLGTFAGDGEEGDLPLSQGIGVRGSSGYVYVSFFSYDTFPGFGSKVEIFIPPPPEAPEVVAAGPANVTATSADLTARIKPNGLPTTYEFEYGTEPCILVPDPCAPVPGGSGSVGSGRQAVKASVHLAGLSAGTAYHFRAIATNELGSDEAERGFTTQGEGGPFALFDGRGWELVSPAQKEGGGSIVPPVFGTVAAAESGGAFTFLSAAPIGADPEGTRTPEFAQSLASHGAAGWSSREMEPPHQFASPIFLGEAAYRLFTPDLALSLVEPQGVEPLSEEASERTPYLHEDFAEPPRWRPLVTGKEGYANVPPGTEFGGEALFTAQAPVRIWAASPDLRHVVLSSEVPLDEAMAGKKGTFFYEWSDGAIKPVSLLGSGPVLPYIGAFGTNSGSVSEDGRFVYWGRDDHGALYLRDMQEGETVRLDLPKAGASGGGTAYPVFQGASADGRHAFFTDPQELTPDAGPGTNLYECEVVKPTSTTKCILRDLTPANGGEGAAVQGMALGISRDGGTVYFVANGALASGAQPGSCREKSGSAKPDWSCNLYVAKREGESWQRTFITRLANKDSLDWGMTLTSQQVEAASHAQVATSSPSGRYLALMSQRSLKGYENADAKSGEADQEAFVYDSQTGELHCVSCNPSGAQPRGTVLDSADGYRVVDWAFPRLWDGRAVAATLPDPSIPGPGFPAFHRPRVVLDNGRVLFNAHDDLVAADANGTWDAYEWEPTGTGGCGSEAFGSGAAAAEGGCVALLSGGTSGRETGVLDASASGNDVFLLTSAALSPKDPDQNPDVYDAHVCAAGWACPTPEAPPSAPCASAGACHPPGASTGEEGTPASALFQGPGNLHPRKHHHKKHKHRKHHHRKHHHHTGGAK